MEVAMKRMAMIFDEWLRQSVERPELFEANEVDKNGKPIEDYGERCTKMFCRIAREMDDANLLPKP